METPEAVDAFHWAGEPGGPLFPSYVVMAQALAADLAPGATVVDLFCGSGRLTATLLGGRPDLRAVGVDLSQRMLAVAARNLADAGVGERVELVRADASTVDEVVRGPVGAVVSMSALHHCPTEDDLRDVLAAVARVRERDGAAVWLFDLVRPEEEALVERIPRGYEIVSGARLPPAFRADWKTSLRAGWSAEELGAACRAVGLDVVSTAADHSQLHRVPPAAAVAGPAWQRGEVSEGDLRRVERLAGALSL